MIHNAPPFTFVEIIIKSCFFDVGTSLDIPFLTEINRFYSLKKAKSFINYDFHSQLLLKLLQILIFQVKNQHGLSPIDSKL